MTWWRVVEGGVRLSLHIQPGAKRTEVAGLHGESLKLRLAAPPVDGKANEQLVAYLAAQFGVPRHRVNIVSGELSRKKLVEISGVASAAPLFAE
ncbi:DUF167 domain-containing protein [Parachitinimonas caeni]|uniref:UPF0235 protein PZA18_09180 n=1 Tax=Parachitinimonas caeni TaxID=3031301 RepID=A0ABT7DVX9_9NEIS|nr:DUF167 family protein [Parachitinimonas caeni]MDK2124219.1 DUF167 family protein [Parachitinimonas caeni]